MALDNGIRGLLMFSKAKVGGKGFGGSDIGFGAGGADRLQQEMGELAEGGGFLAGDAALREKAKHLAEGAVHAGGGGEIAGGGKEFGKVEGWAADAASGVRSSEQLLFALGVIGTERRMNIGAGHLALASVGEHELAAVGQGAEPGTLGMLTALIGIRGRRENFWRNVVGAGGERC